MQVAKPLAVTLVLIGLVYWLSPQRFGSQTAGCGRDQIGCLIASTQPADRDPVSTGSIGRAPRRPVH